VSFFTGARLVDDLRRWTSHFITEKRKRGCRRSKSCLVPALPSFALSSGVNLSVTGDGTLTAWSVLVPDSVLSQRRIPVSVLGRRGRNRHGCRPLGGDWCCRFDSLFRNFFNDFSGTPVLAPRKVRYSSPSSCRAPSSIELYPLAPWFSAWTAGPSLLFTKYAGTDGSRGRRTTAVVTAARGGAAVGVCVALTYLGSEASMPLT
jgi:hypothetical protein